MTKIREGYKETEIGVIPEDWEVKTLGECANKILGGGTPPRNNPNNYNGDIPWITVKDMDGKFYKDDAIEFITDDAIKNSATNLVAENSVIVATRMGLGRGFINTKPVAINQDLKAIILKDDIDSKFFLFWYLSKASMIENLGTGTTVKGIRLETLNSLQLPLPKLVEQQRIAEILSTTDSHIEKLDKTIEDYQLLKKGMMKKLLTEGIGHTEFKETEIGRVPKEWEVVPLSFVTEFIRDGSHGSHKEIEDGIPLLSAKDIINDKVQIPSDCRRISQSDYYKLHKNYELQPGDVLLTIVGTIGRTAIIEKNTEKITFQRSVGIIRTKEKIVPLYLKGYFDSSIFQNQLKNSVNASAQGGVYLNTLSNLMCIVPSIEEQELIADNLFEIDKLIELLKEDRNDLVLLKKSLMDKLLTGKVRVM